MKSMIHSCRGVCLVTFACRCLVQEETVTDTLPSVQPPIFSTYQLKGPVILKMSRVGVVMILTKGVLVFEPLPPENKNRRGACLASPSLFLDHPSGDLLHPPLFKVAFVSF